LDEEEGREKKNRKRVKGNKMRRDIWEISARAVWKIERDLSNVAHYTFSGKNGNNLKKVYGEHKKRTLGNYGRKRRRKV
jgi:hypothetical protein